MIRKEALLAAVAELCSLTYRWANDQTVGAFVTYERHGDLLLETEHDQGQDEHERLAAAGIGDADQISAAEPRRSESLDTRRRRGNVRHTLMECLAFEWASDA